MKELILNFLETNYTFNFESYAYHSLYDKGAERNKGMHSILKDMNTVFIVDSEVFVEAFEEWTSKKVEEVKTLILEVQDKLQKLTGKEVSISDIDLVDLTIANAPFIDYIKGQINFQYNYDNCEEKCLAVPDGGYEYPADAVAGVEDAPQAILNVGVEVPIDQAAQDRAIREEALNLISQGYHMIADLDRRINEAPLNENIAIQDVG